ncbi:MAG: NifB/NifX family molybdenum-iron cluster-binding protein [Thermoplasmatota archaeon]
MSQIYSYSAEGYQVPDPSSNNQRSDRMKIAIPCKVDCIQSPLEDAFEISRHFAIYDTDNEMTEFITLNEFIDGGSAGLFFAKQLIDSGIDVVIAGRIAPAVEQAFKEVDIKIIPNQYGNISDIIVGYKIYQDKLI